MWTTCMLFFQVMLVSGYAYAHIISTKFSFRRQWIIHTSLLIFAILFLPIVPNEYFKPSDGEMPTTKILMLLTFVVGVPFFILASTAPLIQKWYSETFLHRSPYRLYAVSNVGSLLALLSYPFVFEQYLTRSLQANYWAVLFIIFAMAISWIGYRLLSRSDSTDFSSSKTKPAEPVSISKSSAPGLYICLIWMLLAALPSTGLLASTNLLTQEVASNPLLWVLPFSLYLITFIICFDHERWYQRVVFFPELLIAVSVSLFIFAGGTSSDFTSQVVGYCATCFCIGMCCHGELAKLKPTPAYLTLFYLLISIGGALGGLLVAIVAPRFFNDIYEFHLSAGGAIVLCLVTSICVIFNYTNSDDLSGSSDSLSEGSGLSISQTKFSGYLVTIPSLFFVFASVIVLAMVTESFSERRVQNESDSIVEVYRNDYGVIKVAEELFKNEPARLMYHGRTRHGGQSSVEGKSNSPLTYYPPNSGLALTLKYFQGKSEINNLNVGVLGLGAGEVASLGRPGDLFHFYEINPAVLRIANQHFTYLRNSSADISVTLGDGRVSLERQIAQGLDHHFDVLLADAFSSDSVPTHLLTIEAFKVYFQALKPKGILVMHVSNKFMKLEGIVKNNAESLGYSAIGILDVVTPTKWVLVGSNEDFFTSELIDEAGIRYTDRSGMFWSDDYSSIYPLIQWRSKAEK